MPKTLTLCPHPSTFSDTSVELLFKAVPLETKLVRPGAKILFATRLRPPSQIPRITRQRIKRHSQARILNQGGRCGYLRGSSNQQNL
jgi:hypothetical protein